MNNEIKNNRVLPLPKAFVYIAAAFTIISIFVFLSPVAKESSTFWATIDRCKIPATTRPAIHVAGYIASLTVENGKEIDISLQNCEVGKQIRVRASAGIWPFTKNYEANET